METVLRGILSAKREGQPIALVTPVMTEGSLPTGRHARMLVGKDGSSLGTVGGGRMEADAQHVAGEVIENKKSRVIQFSLTAQDAEEDGLLCGGDATFFVESIWPEMSVSPFETMLRMWKEKLPALEVVRLSETEQVSRLVIGKDGSICGSLGSPELDRQIEDRYLEWIEEGVREVVILEVEGEQVQVFLNSLLPEPTVYILGGGHVGLAIARIAPSAGLRVVVIDDRVGFANKARFPNADEVRVMAFDHALQNLPIDDLSYIVVMTRGHKWDREVVAQALQTEAAYIGMIGSQRKVALTFDALKKEGFSRKDIDRIHAPIGLNIGADTPGEIAISVMAELIQIRRKDFLKQRQAFRAHKRDAVPWDVILS